MPLELKPINKLTYELKLTPQIRLGINLLPMPLIKLKEYIEKQVEENPLLELESAGPLKQENYNFDDEKKKNYSESLITKPTTLAEYLLRQLHILITSEYDRKIGKLIIGNIDDDGYLRTSVKEIAESAQASTPKVEEVLSLIQTFDPVGVGARNLRECLLLQLKTKGNLSPEALAKGEENSLAGQIIDKHLPPLEKKRYKYIAKKLKISIEKIKETMKEIAQLEPKPGRSFNTERTIRLIPDAILKKDKQGYAVIFNDWELPRINLNDKYKQMIKQTNTPQDTKEYLKERLKSAQTLIDAVRKHKETIQEVTEEIVSLQKDFLDNGEAGFKPMTLEQIAKIIGKHKSTIARAVTNKYLQTPWGIVELRSFLNSGVKQKNGELFSSKAIKSKIKDLIENENKNNPLSDQQIVGFLKQEGISVSRRTIAKYRTRLKLLPSQSRRE